MSTVLDTPWTGQTFSPTTPLDIAAIETAIVKQLGASITAVEVAHYPDKPESYRLTHRVGAALVRYLGAKYLKLIDTAAVVQERRLEFEVILMMRDLGWSFGGEASGTSPGAYSILEAVRAALTGFQVPGCSKTYPVREHFVERDKQGGVWIYAIAFALTTVAVEPSMPDNFPLFVKGIAEEQGGLTTISLAPAPYTFNSNGQIQLPNSNLSAVIVLNPTSGAVYVNGTDYTIDAPDGVIMRAATGAIPTGATVNVAYSYSEAVIAIAGGGSAPKFPTN